jgi:HK97 family phage major capsid protein
MTSQTTATDTTLLLAQVAEILVQPLTVASTFLAAGPQVFDTARQLRIPRISSGISAGFVAESTAIPEGSVGFDEVVLLPSTMKSLKTVTRFSNELIREAVIGLDAVLRTRLVADVAIALDAALFTGTGASNTIKGIINQTGVQTGVLDVSSPDGVGSLLDAIGLAQAANVTPNRWFMSPADFISLRKLKSTTKEFIFDEDMHGGTQLAVFGIPVSVTNHLATGKAVLTDMNSVAVARDLDASVFLMDQTYAASDEQGLRVVTRYDLGLLQPTATVVLTVAP